MKPLPVADLDHVLDNTRGLWESARGKRFFLSGATGFFGIWLLESLAFSNRKLDLGISAVVLSRDTIKFRDRFPHIAQQPCFQFLAGDVRTFEYPSGEFDYVLHAAAPTAAAVSLDAEELSITLIDGMRRVLSFAKTHGTKRMLFVSSGIVYGAQPAEMTHVSEAYRSGGPDWINPDFAYAEGKRVAEQLCAIAARSSNLQIAIARCFAFVGPHLPLDQHFAIGNFIRNALVGQPIQIKGDGRPMRSYLYAADLAIWLWTLLLAQPADKSNPAIVNVGSAEDVSIGELAHRVASVINPELHIEIAEKGLPSGPPPRYVPDVRRAEQLYGLRQTVGLDEAIRRTAAWHRS